MGSVSSIGNLLPNIISGCINNMPVGKLKMDHFIFLL